MLKLESIDWNAFLVTLVFQLNDNSLPITKREICSNFDVLVFVVNVFFQGKPHGTPSSLNTRWRTAQLPATIVADNPDSVIGTCQLDQF